MTTLNPSEATSLALNTLTSQIRLLADMPAEHCKQAVAGLDPIVTANLTMISEAANAHIDEFNGLIDQLEARDGELLTQAALVSELRRQVDEAGQRIAAAQQGGAPDEMTRDIFAFMHEALELSHPHLQPRTEWAKTVSIHECGLPPRTIKPLEEAGIDTLYKVMSHQGNKLNKVKGIGEKLVGQVIYACELVIKAWEQENNATKEAA